MPNRITPFIRRLRTNGGTLYCFSSATEDIGLNISERNNTVAIQNFALLNIPPVYNNQVALDNSINRFNFINIPGAFQYQNALALSSVKDGNYLIAESFQNYALNLEANLLNQDTYNPTLLNTVSERVFWKWLKESGAVRFTYDSSIGHFTEEPEFTGGYNSVVKYVGLSTTGNMRTDTFGSYNETYIQIPTSHGQTRAYFKQTEDDNYYHGLIIDGGDTNILGRETYVLPHPDGLGIQAFYDFNDSSTSVAGTAYTTQYYDPAFAVWRDGWWYTPQNINATSPNAYMIDSSSYMTTSIYNDYLKFNGAQTITYMRSKVDCLGLQFDLGELRTIFGDSTLTFDKLAINNAINDNFEYNAILLYYNVYNQNTTTPLATNLFGVLFLDAPIGNSSTTITIPSLEKIQSTASGFGTSFSHRLNLRTDSIIDNTLATYVDESTSSQTNLDNFTDIMESLSKSVNILNQHTGTINYISQQYSSIIQNQSSTVSQLNQLLADIQEVQENIQGSNNTMAMFSSGGDPLIDSSIFMKNGRVGIFTPDPSLGYGLHVDTSTSKFRDIVIEKAIRDGSGNILLSYGSPMQIGATTERRPIHFYVGTSTPVFTIDENMNFNFDGSLYVKGTILRPIGGGPGGGIGPGTVNTIPIFDTTTTLSNSNITQDINGIVSINASLNTRNITINSKISHLNNRDIVAYNTGAISIGNATDVLSLFSNSNLNLNSTQINIGSGLSLTSGGVISTDGTYATALNILGHSITGADGGSITLTGGTASDSYNGGGISLIGGNSDTGNPGSIDIQPGSGISGGYGNILLGSSGFTGIGIGNTVQSGDIISISNNTGRIGIYGDVYIPYSLFASSAKINGDISIGGDLHVLGNQIFDGLIITTDLSVQGAASFVNLMSVNASTSGNLEVMGEAYFGNNINVTNNVIVGNTLSTVSVLTNTLDVLFDTNLQSTIITNLRVDNSALIQGDLFVDGSTTIWGNLIVEGSTFYVNVDQMNVSDNFINLNTGFTGTPPLSLQSGIAVTRGDLDPYVFLFDETNQTFRIGIASETSTGYLDSSTQAVATRQDSPVSNGLVFWNDSDWRFDTSSGITYDGSVLHIRCDVSIDGSLFSYSTDLSAAIGDLFGNTVHLNGSVWDVSDYVSKTYVDGSLSLKADSSYLETYFIRSSSIGNTLYWSNSYFNVSTGYPTKPATYNVNDIAKFDASGNLKSADVSSFGFLFGNSIFLDNSIYNVSTGYLVKPTTYTAGNLAKFDASGNIVDASITSLVTDISTIIGNLFGETIYLNSTGIYDVSSVVGLSYADSSAISTDSSVFRFSNYRDAYLRYNITNDASGIAVVMSSDISINQSSNITLLIDNSTNFAADVSWCGVLDLSANWIDASVIRLIPAGKKYAINITSANINNQFEYLINFSKKGA